MAAPKDGVHLQKYEDTATGGDDADQADAFATTAPLESWEDAPYVQGIFIQPPDTVPAAVDKVVYVTRDGAGNMLFRDVVGGTEYTLAQLFGAAPVGFDVDTILVDDVSGAVLTDSCNVLVNE